MRSENCSISLILKAQKARCISLKALRYVIWKKALNVQMRQCSRLGLTLWILGCYLQLLKAMKKENYSRFPSKYITSIVYIYFILVFCKYICNVLCASLERKYMENIPLLSKQYICTFPVIIWYVMLVIKAYSFV